jgi:hypothetical protein
MRIVGLALAALFACNNSSTYTPFLGLGGIGSLASSTSIPKGSTTLDISGAFFDPTMTVFWNGARQTTHVASSTRASVDLAPGLTAAPGTAQVTAQNEGGFLSAPITVSVF